MEAMINELKRRIRIQKTNVESLENERGQILSRKVFTEETSKRLEELFDVLSRESNKLRCMRNALVSLINAEGNFDVNVFEPEEC